MVVDARAAAVLTAGLTILGAVACGTGTEPAGPFPEISGRIHPVGGGSPSGLWAFWEPDDGAPPDSAVVEADGSFTIETTRSSATGLLRIDGRTPRAHHPIVVPYDTADGPAELLAVPRAWTIGSGAFAGEVVPTPLDPVVDDEVRDMLYSYLWGQQDPFDAPVRYLIEPKAWPLEHLPARVAFDHANAEIATDAADSAAVWELLDEIEGLVGLDLFEPADSGFAWWPAGTAEEHSVAPGRIRVLRLAGRWRGQPLSAAAPWSREGDFGALAEGERFSRFLERHRRLDAGLLIFPELAPLRLADGEHPWQTVVTHELLHVLGAGHTYRIPSPMGPRMRTPRPSAEDVAYLELSRALVEAAFAIDPTHGIVPSIAGERRILLGDTWLPRLGG